MPTGIIKELGADDKPYYDYQDVMNLLGVSRAKAYSILKNMREECVKKGIITAFYPHGKIPRKYFNKMCMIE